MMRGKIETLVCLLYVFVMSNGAAKTPGTVAYPAQWMCCVHPLTIQPTTQERNCPTKRSRNPHRRGSRHGLKSASGTGRLTNEV
jgi:hypothetical protein